MSITSPPSATALDLAADASSSCSLHSLGLGCTIAIAVTLLALLSTLLLISCICFQSPPPRGPAPNATGSGGVIPPLEIVVAEEEDDDNDRDEEAAAAVVRGLEQTAINSYPKFYFSGATGEEPPCSICLCEYRDGETLRMMPDCRHYFHLICVDAWLRINASCPVCRTSPVPTPLSLLAPLSHYDADSGRG